MTPEEKEMVVEQASVLLQDQSIPHIIFAVTGDDTTDSVEFGHITLQQKKILMLKLSNSIRQEEKTEFSDGNKMQSALDRLAYKLCGRYKRKGIPYLVAFLYRARDKAVQAWIDANGVTTVCSANTYFIDISRCKNVRTACNKVRRKVCAIVNQKRMGDVS